MALDAKLLEALNDKNTLVVVPEAGREHKMVMEWLRMNAPKVIQTKRVFTELDVAALQQGQQIMTVYHDPEFPLVNYEPDRSGALQAIYRPMAELKDEMVVTQPVKLDESNWTTDPDRPMRAGRPNTARFLSALGAAVTPKCFGYADRGEKHPRILKLETI